MVMSLVMARANSVHQAMVALKLSTVHRFSNLLGTKELSRLLVVKTILWCSQTRTMCTLGVVDLKVSSVCPAQLKLHPLLNILSSSTARPLPQLQLVHSILLPSPIKVIFIPGVSAELDSLVSENIVRFALRLKLNSLL